MYLAIDTSNEYLGLGLVNVDKYYQHLVKAGNKQSELILPAIEGLMQEAGITISDIRSIIYNQGPGSFTGLRIGLSTALAISYANNCDLIPLPSFALYVDPNSSEYKYTIVTLDARLGQIYMAAINHLDFSYLIPPCLVNPQDLAGIITSEPQLSPLNTSITGNGLLVYKSQIAESIIDDFNYIDQPYPSPVRMIRLAELDIYPKVSPFDAGLLYLRNKVALDINEQKQNKKT